MQIRTSIRLGLHERGKVLLFIGLFTIIGGCSSESSSPSRSAPSFQPSSIPDSMTIPRMLETDDRFSTLRTALDSTGLDSLLATDGPYTLFAPPNEAFEALPPGTMDALLSERTERLRTILAHHVVEERLSLEGSPSSRTVTTLSSDTLSLQNTQDGFLAAEAPVVDENIGAANGLLHVVDQVLPPPSEPTAP